MNTKTHSVINELLVDIFNDILVIEQRVLKNGKFSDVSITEVHTIEAIGIGEAKSMGEVAKTLEITVGTLTIAINNLVKKGYVERVRSETDRRVVKISLTQKAKLLYELHEKFHSDMVKETVTGLSKEEERVLITSLEKLNGFFKEKHNVIIMQNNQQK